ncbi:MAG: hypothetical protein AAB733_04645 [Patescibacteria group bacterium]
MDLPKIIGILGTAEDRCGLVSLVTSQGNGRLVLRVQDPNGTVQKPYSHEELAEAMAVEGGGLPINPAIPFCVPSVRGGWFGGELLRTSQAWRIPLPPALRQPLRQFSTGIFWLDDLEAMSKVLAEWANTAAAAILFMRNPPSPRFLPRFLKLFPGLPVTYAVLFITAPNAEHQWVAVQRYIRKMSPEGRPLTEKEARAQIQGIVNSLQRIYQRTR